MSDIIYEKLGNADATFTVTDCGRYLEIELDNPWQGSTEQGFGARLSFNLMKEDVSELLIALNRWI